MSIKYKLVQLILLSPFSVIALGLVLFGIIVTLKGSPTDSLRGISLIAFSAIAIALLLLDIVLKMSFQSIGKVSLIQIALILIFFIYRMINHTSLKLVVPENNTNKYLTIVHLVDGKNALPNAFKSLYSSINFQDDGYILTSSESRRNYKLILEDKNKGYSTFTNNVQIGSSNYDFTTFKIQDLEECCNYDYEEVITQKKIVFNYLIQKVNDEQ